MSAYAASTPVAIAREGGLNRALTKSQIVMIGIGGAIGTGLFMGSGIAIGYAVYLKGKGDPKKIELPILAQGWRYDSTIAAFFGGPARKMADFTAFVIDRKGIDGAVNRIAKLATGSGQQLRKTQSGYVRNYAAYIAFGAVVLLGWFVIRAGL